MKIIENQKSIWLIILLSTIIRLFKIHYPLTFEHDWNTAIWSIIARNIVLEGKYSPLYLNHPPLIIFLEVISFKIFGINEFAARIIPILCSAFSIFYFYKLILFLYKEKEIAFWSSLTFGFLPLTLFFGRMLNHEPVIILFMLLTLYHYALYAKNVRKNHLYLSYLFFFFLSWTDVYGILILFSLFYLSLKDKLKEFLIFPLIALFSFSSWYLWVSFKGELPRLLGAVQHWGEFSGSLFKNSQFWETIFLQWLPDLYTPVIMVLFIFASLYLFKHHKVILYWLLGVCFLFLLVPRWFYVHNYAFYYFVPPITAMVGWFFQSLKKYRRVQIFLLILFMGFSFSSTKEKFSTCDNSLYKTSLWIKENTRTFDQIGIVGNYYIQHPPLEFYSQRKVIPELPEDIKTIKAHKVRYIISGGLENKLFEKYLNDYKVKSIEKYSIYDLK